MASDSQTEIETTTEKPLENKVNEEAKLMEKETVADVVKDKPVLDSNLTVMKEGEIDQTFAGEPEKESPAVVEVVGVVVEAEESTEKDKNDNGEKVAEQLELKEPIIVKDEAVDEEKAEEKKTVESVVEEDNKDKEETKLVDVSESTDEAGSKQVEPVAVQSVRDVSAETSEDKIKDVEVLEDEPKPEASEKVETQPEKAKELAPEVEIVKAEETPETTEQAKVELEGKLEDRIVETKDSSINSKDEKTSESDSALCPEEIIQPNQEPDTDTKKETEEVASSAADVIEKAITEEKHVVDEPSEDEKISESVSALSPEKIVPKKNQESDTDLKKETEADASSPADVIEKAITEEKHIVDEPSKVEKTSESGTALSPEKIVPTNQDSDTNLEKKTEGEASSPADVIVKAFTEEKHVVEEPSKDEKENISEAKLATEDENIKKDTEPVADSKIEETLKETAADKQEESITEKVTELVETEPVVVKENNEPKQQPEVTAKEVTVKQKHSNSIISKVKQSFVKAKKAIIGKSPSSKTISTEEAKGEIKVK